MSLFYKIVQWMLVLPALQNIRILFYFYDSLILRFLPKPERKAGKKKVLVVFPLSLGDAVMFYGTIPYLLQMYPKEEYDVVLTCHEEYRELFREQFSGIIPIDYRRASVDLRYRAVFLRKMRRTYYDIAVDPVGSEKCSPNLYAMNAVCAGLKVGVLSETAQKYQCPAWLRKSVYDILLAQKKDVHKVQYYAKVCSLLGGKACRPAVAKLPVGSCMALPKKYFIVYPSASVPVKMWPVERFAEIAERIWREKNWSLVVCGREQDRLVTERLLRLIPKKMPVCNLIAKTTVMQLLEVVGRAALVLTNDTSVYHIAVGTGRKTCVVSGGYVYDQFLDYLSNGYETEAEICIAAHKSDCMNCNNHCIKRVEGVYPCVLANTVDEVWEKVRILIAEKTKETEKD